MSEKKNEKQDRRTFLKGAALASAVVILEGPSAVAQERLTKVQQKKKVLWAVPPPPGDNAPEDDLEELQPLMKAALGEAMSKAEAVIEKMVRSGGKTKTLNISKALAAEGLTLRSPGARKAATTIKVPAIITKKAREAKAEGWHLHGQISQHTHMTW
ncbi:MAG: hypothetical protein ACE5IY_11415 [bacterium]